MQNSPRILVVDDHPIARLGICQLLLRDLPTADVAEASSGGAAIDRLREERCDLMVLDISMPGTRGDGLSGFDVLEQVCDIVSTLMLSVHSDRDHVIRALRSGAAGYLVKTSAPAKLSLALTQIMDHGFYVDPAVSEHVAFDLAKGLTGTEHVELSPRELEVLVGIADGKTPTEIAGALGLSVKTVSTYRGRLLEKTGLKSTQALIRYGIDHALVPRG